MSTEYPDAATVDPSDGPANSGLGRWGRVGSAAVGGALLTLGARRRSLSGTAAALVGGWLVYRSVSGRGVHDRGRGGGGAPASGRDESERDAGTADVTRSVTVGKSADEIYESWRDPETQARIFGGFADVTAPSEDRLRWEVDAPLGRTVSWETQIVEDRPGELVRWESLDGVAVISEGSARFSPAPGDRGTEVTLRLRVDPPGGSLGRAAMERLGVVPETLTNKALRRFKSLVETGEVPTLAKNPSARGEGDLL